MNQDDTPAATPGDALAAIPRLLADLTARRLADGEDWTDEDRGRFDALAARVAALTDRDGRGPFGGPPLTPVLADAADAAGWDDPFPPAKLAAVLARDAAGARRVRPRKKWRPVWTDGDGPQFQAETTSLALLRGGWEPDADAAVVAWDGVAPRLELRPRGRAAVSGRWGVTLSLDGADVPLDDWRCVCRHDDADGGYLELQCTPAGVWADADGVAEEHAAAVRVELQVFLSRRDRFAVLAAAAHAGAGADGDDPARVDLGWSLPVVPGRDVLPDPRTREVRFSAGGRGGKVRAFPLWLPQFRATGAAGAFVGKADSLAATAAGLGGAYAPVVLDWRPKRRHADADWRTLTVTEDHRPLGPSAASGHRLRVGKRQLLVYRATDNSDEPRAVLGHHHDRETLVARFKKSGEVEPLVMV